MTRKQSSSLSSPAAATAVRNHQQSGRKQSLILLFMLVCVIVSPLFAVGLGSAKLPADQVAAIIAHHLGFPVEVTWDRAEDAIVWLTRLPRIIAAIGIGAILGVSGVALQAIVRNPLAEPYVLGVSAGASTGAAFAIIILGTTAAWMVGGLAFAGALLATLAVLGLAGRRQATSLQLVLAGLAIGFSFQAVTNLLIFYANTPETSRSVMFWMLGSLSRATWPMSIAVLAIGVVLTLLLFVLGRMLNALASGDNTALAVGIDPSTARLLLLIPVSAAVSIAVATAGAIGFVGLIIPHLMRPLVGYAHPRLVLGSALAGSLFLLWMDTAARIMFAPAEIPIGVMTGLIGAPFLVLLLRRQPMV